LRPDLALAAAGNEILGQRAVDLMKRALRARQYRLRRVDPDAELRDEHPE